jgi:hypothetical protein
MIDHIFINGCSFNQSNPKAKIDTYAGKMIAEHFDKPFTNFARGGRGNYRICTTTKMWFESTEKKTNTLAVIEWTSPFRRDYPSNDGWKPMPGYSTTWRTWATTSNLPWCREKRAWDFDQEHSLFMLNSMLDLQWYFKANQIPYIMYHGLPGEIDTKFDDHKILWNSVDKNHVYLPFKSHAEFINEANLFVSDQDYHPTEQGHLQWADSVISFIKQLYQEI